MVRLPQWLARFDRHVTNPVQRMWAGFVPTMGILDHVGRRSGYGRTFAVSNPRVMTKAEAAPHVSVLWRPIFTMLPFENAVLLTRA